MKVNRVAYFIIPIFVCIYFVLAYFVPFTRFYSPFKISRSNEMVNQSDIIANTSGSNTNLSASITNLYTAKPFRNTTNFLSTIIPKTNETREFDLPYDDIIGNISGSNRDLYIEKPLNFNVLDPPLKIILFWNTAYNGNRHFGFGYGREPFFRAKCRINTCLTTSDRKLFPPHKIDALIWHWRSSDKSFPKNRYPHTRYIFWMMESASHTFGDLRPYKNVFNWTLTYRLDSDFPNPYGRMYRRRFPLPDENRNFAEGKTKMAAMFVSNCHTLSGREKVVQNLKNWMNIDVYGSCGSLKCGRNELGKCHRMLSQDYKFYLSFENSLCRDYATEKFFNMMGVDVIPVVYGHGNYSIQAPKHSFIDALSFTSTKSLADYLLYLNSNDTAYNEYFRWRRDYMIANYWARVSRAYCDICEKLHNDNTTKTYDIYKWFVEESHCTSKSSTRISNFIG